MPGGASVMSSNDRRTLPKQSTTFSVLLTLIRPTRRVGRPSFAPSMMLRADRRWCSCSDPSAYHRQTSAINWVVFAIASSQQKANNNTMQFLSKFSMLTSVAFSFSSPTFIWTAYRGPLLCRPNRYLDLWKRIYSQVYCKKACPKFSPVFPFFSSLFLILLHSCHACHILSLFLKISGWSAGAKDFTWCSVARDGPSQWSPAATVLCRWGRQQQPSFSVSAEGPKLGSAQEHNETRHNTPLPEETIVKTC